MRHAPRCRCSCSASVRPTHARSRRWWRRCQAALPRATSCVTTWRRYSRASRPFPTRSRSPASPAWPTTAGRAGRSAASTAASSSDARSTPAARCTCLPRSLARSKGSCGGYPSCTRSRSPIGSSVTAASATRTRRASSRTTASPRRTRCGHMHMPMHVHDTHAHTTHAHTTHAHTTHAHTTRTMRMLMHV